MAHFLWKKLLALLLTLLAAAALIFAVLHLLPGNAAQVLLGPDADPQAVAALATQLGLDTPAWPRFTGWLRGLLHGDLGHSYAYGEPVADLLLQRLQLTVPLALLALGVSGLLALPMGLYAAAYQGRWPDKLLMGSTQLGLAIPSFWLAMLLIVVFAVRLQWVSAGGFPGWTQDSGGGLLPALQALILPHAGAGGGANGHFGAADALGGAGACGRETLAHRPRQGAGPPPNPLGPCAAQCHGADFDPAGAAVCQPAGPGPSWWKTSFTCPAWAACCFRPLPTATCWWCKNGVLLLVAMVIVVNFSG